MTKTQLQCYEEKNNLLTNSDKSKEYSFKKIHILTPISLYYMKTHFILFAEPDVKKKEIGF